MHLSKITWYSFINVYKSLIVRSRSIKLKNKTEQHWSTDDSYELNVNMVQVTIGGKRRAW